MVGPCTASRSSEAQKTTPDHVSRAWALHAKKRLVQAMYYAHKAASAKKIRRPTADDPDGLDALSEFTRWLPEHCPSAVIQHRVGPCPMDIRIDLTTPNPDQAFAFRMRWA